MSVFPAMADKQCPQFPCPDISEFKRTYIGMGQIEAPGVQVIGCIGGLGIERCERPEIATLMGSKQSFVE